jgi:folate-dependent phosphoribosylglycinamide formyltransferase PurN
VINTHPSLLPLFPGLDAPAQATPPARRSPARRSHRRRHVDGGPIHAQIGVPVMPATMPRRCTRIQREGTRCYRASS